MKRMMAIVLVLILILSLLGCTKEKTIVGTWEVLTVGEFDLRILLHIEEDGTGAWEYQGAGFEEGIQLPFLYVLQDNNLTMCFEGNSKQVFIVEYDEDKLILDGEKYYVLKSIN